MPYPFDLQGGWPLCAARSVMVGALLSVFGTLAFRCIVAPKAFAYMPQEAVGAIKARLLIVLHISTAMAILAAGIWLLLQAGFMADATGVAGSIAAMPKVVAKTAFGHVITAQAVTLVVLLGVAGWQDRNRRLRAAFGLAALALVLQAGHSHAFSMYGGPSVLLACDVLHLLGAGAWLGGLVPLLLLVRTAAPNAGAVAARWFSPLGKWCIGALVVSAAFQAWVLVATVPGLVGTAYGLMILVKLTIFAVLLGFAAANRYRFAPALLRHDAGEAKRVLTRSILLQTGFAIAIVAAAAILSELPPAMHTQPLWPFAQRFSLAAVNEDPDFRREVVLAGLALGGGVLALTVALLLRRLRIAACLLAAVAAWFAAPHLQLLLVTAYPTSYYHSPTEFSSSAIVDGRDIYAENCVSCHGATGRGDGPSAKGLPEPPADLTASHLWMHSDGELFWWIGHGMETPEGAQAMPGFGSLLGDEQIWAVIDFIRARNAGDTARSIGTWTPPLRAPGFDANCGETEVKSADLRGQFVLLQFGARAPAPHIDGLVNVLAGPGHQSASRGTCTNQDQTVADAYAIVSGIERTALEGTDFLIDDQGWLRAMQRDGAAMPWSNATNLAAEVRMLRAKPVANAPAPAMNMKM